MTPSHIVSTLALDTFLLLFSTPAFSDDDYNPLAQPRPTTTATSSLTLTQ